VTAIPQILVIDDDSGVVEIIDATAQKLGLACTACTTATTFLEALTPETTLIMMDLMMPEMDGIELLRLLGEQQCKAGIVLMSGSGKRIVETAEQFAQSIGLVITGRLRKPFRLTELETIPKTPRAPVTTKRPGQRAAVPPDDAELHDAVERNEFVLHYQPQIDLATDRIVGVEALVRWQHPERGLIFPDDFIPRAEALGLIDQLGWIVANRGMKEVGLFTDKYGFIPKLSINIAAQSLRDLKFPDKYAALLKKHKIEAKNTIIEITESGLIQELSTTLDVLTRLRLKQVQLSIDDFGTGYSMMQQLRNIPATELKIDKSFVQNMHGTESDRVMVQKTIEIGHDLGMKVVAEGVETAEQLAFLRANSCDIVQGYLFTRPLPVKDLQTWLHNYRSGKLMDADQPISQPRPKVFGVALDARTRCAHYNKPEDIIAIKMKCCGEYYACKECHDALANHPSAVWSRSEWNQLAITCGACAAELTIQQYLDCDNKCPSCRTHFNPACRDHYHLYFEMPHSAI
jgi:EAL domain-containing protein (putative c-di-GMP-specific phosphodiesterase class I)/uncharacterized CHY-type Zn-finger protein